MRMDNMHERQDNIAEDEIYAYESGIASLDQIANENNGISYFINACGRTIMAKRHEEFTRLGVLSSYISSVFGGQLDDDERTAVGGAFLKGAVTGVCVSDLAYEETVDITDVILTIEANRMLYDDDTAFYAGEGRQLIESGLKASNQMLMCNDVIESWESACVTDIRYHQYYRMGLGIYMSGASKAMQNVRNTEDMKRLSDKLDAGDIDWDAAFADMTKGE
jgi:hypothetical protein